MALKSYHPNTAGTRFRTISTFSELTKGKAPEKKLLSKQKKVAGRNNYGRITVRRIGGGHRQQYRAIDFKRNKFNIPAKVVSIEYDPIRTARIALLQYVDGEKRYIIAPTGLVEGASILSGSNAEPKVGNALFLKDIPVGEMIHNIELHPRAGGQLVRGAGTGAQLMAKDGKYAQVRLPSGEQRKVLLECMATIGVVGNADHANRSLGKAGVSRWLGKRPKVRGVAMNPVDHPHGGGEGKTSGGRHPVTPWGKPTKGWKTRANKRTDKFIVRRRSK